MPLQFPTNLGIESATYLQIQDDVSSQDQKSSV